jgi:FAD binding domain-containing protein/berberine-like enzyme
VGTNGTAAESARRELGAGFEGELIGPDDPQYDEARALFNAMIDKRPALIARVASPADVARVVGFARAHDLPLAIRGAGHNGGGLGSVDDGVVADLSLLHSVSVDPEARTVRVGGGATWGQVDAATHEHGLAVPSGVISTTGVGGLTLGGGMGHLTRAHGLTVDNLLGAEVVLADGQTVSASADENSDLFWALRGGGGNFGVVTEFTFQAHPVSEVVGGPTFWPIEETDEVLKAYREFLPTLPRNATGFFAFHTVPPAPPFPEEIHLRKVCGIVWCIVGSDEEAEQATAPMLAVGTPLMHGAQRMPFPALNSAFDGLYGPGEQWYWRADFVNEIPDEAIARNAEWSSSMPTWKSASHIYPIDGAAHDRGRDETPWAHRDTRWSQVIVGVDPDPAGASAVRDWTVGYWEALHPYSAGGAYVNFMMADEGQERVRATYSDNYDRLAKIKAAYDPENVFRVNQNIRPAT